LILKPPRLSGGVFTRKIRNDFAHEWVSKDFTHTSDRIKELIKPMEERGWFNDMRDSTEKQYSVHGKSLDFRVALLWMVVLLEKFNQATSTEDLPLRFNHLDSIWKLEAGQLWDTIVLSMIDGISIKLASRIADRMPFNSVDELRSVNGVGEKKLQILLSSDLTRDNWLFDKDRSKWL